MAGNFIGKMSPPTGLAPAAAEEEGMEGEAEGMEAEERDPMTLTLAEASVEDLQMALEQKLADEEAASGAVEGEDELPETDESDII